VANRRTIFCTDCGAQLNIPAKAEAGRKVRCGVCKTIFVIPELKIVAGKDDLKKPTEVGSYNIEDLPDDLQDYMASLPDDQKAPRFPTPVTGLDIPSVDDETAARTAFDLDKKNAPRRITGVGIIDTQALEQFLEEDGEEDE